jgi:zinc transporter, ZIP family
MPTGTIILLGAFAGLTIYLGLPIAFLKRMPASSKMFLSMLATGILVFLLYDVISKASEPIGAALDEVRTAHTGGATFFTDLLLLVAGLVIGLIGLVYFNAYVIARSKRGTPAKAADRGGAPVPVPNPAALALAGVGAADLSTIEARPTLARPAATGVGAVAAVPARELSPRMLALIIATGIGLHNFSEGLAIGQSAAANELQLAAVLVIGFGLHNMTEGFGIAGPLSNQSVSWKFIGLLGLIGGGPTFLGTVVGMAFHSPQIFIFCLALAAGAILYVIAELMGVSRRFKAQNIVMWGLLAGFLLGYVTDLIVTYAGV